MFISSLTEPVRPGECPVIAEGTVGSCDTNCEADSVCPDDHKCCYNGCGYDCVPGEDQS